MSVFKRIPNNLNYAITPFGELIHINKYETIKHYTNRRTDGHYLCFIDGIYYRVDQLVAQTWIENPNRYTHVRHIDGNPSNNDVTNLEWIE